MFLRALILTLVLAPLLACALMRRRERNRLTSEVPSRKRPEGTNSLGNAFVWLLMYAPILTMWGFAIYHGHH